MRMRSAVAAAGLAGALACLAAPSAVAMSGALTVSFGKISYDDSGDSYTVCDTATDSVGVTGRISVQQADGSWHHFAWRRDGTGDDGTCAGNNVDVLREAADVRLTICRQNGADGPRYDCRSATLLG